MRILLPYLPNKFAVVTGLEDFPIESRDRHTYVKPDLTREKLDSRFRTVTVDHRL